jgi:NitT/TauT family transport system substrate-binding protein
MKGSRSRNFILLVSIIILLIACQEIITPPKVTTPPLKIAYSPWPGYLPIIIAKEKGFFQKEGVNVELFFSEETRVQVADFSAGKYDGTLQDLGTMIIASGKNPDIRIVFVIDESAGADAIIVDPSLETIADLKGKSVATDLSGFGELFVMKMLETANLTRDDINLINMAQEKVPESLKRGEIQAGHTWEPYLSQAVKEGAKIIFTSAETPGLIPDVMAFLGSVVRDRAGDVRAFIRAWFQAVDYWKTHPEEGNAIIAKEINTHSSEISLKGIKLLTLNDNVKSLTPGKTTESLYHTAELYINFFTNAGSLTQPVDLQKLIDSTLVKS